ncbi:MULTISPECIES: ABC transporter ATP-binding protein [Aerococcus]|uniref:ABC transporter ATP-binding protein n=1 Tax=Aerococcus TaxID=1375 RepID=UPI000200EC11|nr:MULTISPECIES: ATP-binding cassette domain-containing protein [Aerococcus]AEA01463.1 ABC transporter, ATP-binding protein [Aerococcus sp. Group 1]MCY3030498.1 ATP-binding cassette domain-containing protein [Aerococcus sp. Group 1]MCY3054541.1 ATP-binding cassette domain-containing protein [Aerococcus sp. Group 1]MCY3056271.1 ATP-binding cassette domain-containing protein [Aerococcus sp. Group 1]MCY3061729.1 ATP-binding cassette domain-containing protein [Aerococcus sp. Group 1]
MSELLKLKQVNKVFNMNSANENHVLKNFNLRIHEGDFICVIGSNGAGKSTLLNLIAGTIPVTSGKIYLKGKNITQKPAPERAKHISRVFQDPQMGTARNLTIEENLAIAYKRGNRRSFNRAVTDDMRKIFHKKLGRLNLGLDQRLTTPASNLSGGQRQVLTLLMAILEKPELLLLDEHIAALDPRTSAMVMELTDQLITENSLTSLMITHDMNDALSYGNRLIMLHAGRIVVDVSGEDKRKLNVEDLMELFKQSVGSQLVSDELLLQT